MASMATGQPPPVEVGQTQGPLEEIKISYANTLVAPKKPHHSLQIKPLTYLHGEPKLVWEEEEVQQMIVNEDLQYAVIGKFSYGWPDILDLRKLIPKQCELKREVNIGLLCNRYVLIRASLLEDYVKLLSKPQFYITHNHWSYPMQALKWDLLFDLEEETTTAIAWISFPSLPPKFFGKETILSMAAAVGRPLQVDLATQNKTRPSCARVKVEVDLLGEFSKRKNIGMRKKTREIMEKWVTINYDYVPKYCKTCKLQGHNEKDYYVIHPELFPQDEQKEEKEQKQDNKENKGERGNQADGKCANGKKQEQGDRVQEDNERNTNFREQRRRYGYEKGYQIQNRMTAQVWNVRTSQVNAEVTTKNKFGALEREDDKQDTFTHQADEGNKSLPAQQKAVTQQEGNRRQSVTWSSNFHIKENKMGLEQIYSLENPIEKNTGSNGTQLEANKAMIDKEREREKINALEL
ncbi:hypothetical protein KY290_013066 [Solanum tuberosum]|uniref:DUF4283 domain-containing protein n=1 Tax=Solanum tuberosum TaxID=4113 RepID=A0ABQ7VLF3_SOLTU|nr:hypothetical protein KY285_012838 [Solanum tuberosum]KAH0769085.1 hypothetical protein KY290_013066 [Solanum tuberosum]